MENLTTQSSLRSLDESGRPLTAGRPSYPEARETSFDGHLERARAETREEERVADQRDARNEVSTRKERATERAADEPRGESTGADERRADDASQAQEEAQGPESRQDDDGVSEEGSADREPAEETAEESVPILAAQEAPELIPLSLSGAATSAVSEGAEGQGIEAQGGASDATPQVAGSGALPQAVGAEGGVRAAAAATSAVSGPEAGAAPESKSAPQASTRPEAEAVRAPIDPERIARAESVLNQIRLRLGNDLRSATLALEPAELGRLKVQIEVEAGSVRAELRVESAEALAALERHVPELRAMLSADGLELADVTISLAPEGQFDEAGERGFHDREQSEQASGEAADASEAPTTLTRALADEAGVDFLA